VENGLTKAELRWAPDADTRKYVESFDRFDEFHGRLFAEHLNMVMRNFVTGSSILDVGSGFCRLWAYALEDFRSNWTSLEQNRYFINVARQREWGGEIVQGSVYSMSSRFGKEAFDNVIGLSSYYWFGDLNKAVAETAQVLKPGGRFICLWVGEFDMAVIDEEITKLLREVFDIEPKKLREQVPGSPFFYWVPIVPENAEDIIDEKYANFSSPENLCNYSLLMELIRQTKRGHPADYDAFFEIKMKFAIERAGLLFVVEKGEAGSKTKGSFLKYIVAEKPSAAAAGRAELPSKVATVGSL